LEVDHPLVVVDHPLVVVDLPLVDILPLVIAFLPFVIHPFQGILNQHQLRSKMQGTFVHFGINIQRPSDSSLEPGLFEDYFRPSCSKQAVCKLGYLVELVLAVAATLELVAVVRPLAVVVAGIATAFALVKHFEPLVAAWQLVAVRQVTIGLLTAA